MRLAIEASIFDWTDPFEKAKGWKMTQELHVLYSKQLGSNLCSLFLATAIVSLAEISGMVVSGLWIGAALTLLAHWGLTSNIDLVVFHSAFFRQEIRSANAKDKARLAVLRHIRSTCGCETWRQTYLLIGQ